MIILCGPSASGKSEICKSLCFKFGFKKFVTTTTRNIRIGEIDGIDYNFISKEEFLNKIKNDEFIEYVEYNGNYYGTEKNRISDKTVLIIEANGLKKFKELNNKHIVSFFLNCDEKIREERMIYRQDKLEDIKKRLELDRTSLSYDTVKDYVDFLIDTNNDSVIELTAKIHDIYTDYIKNS